MEKYWNILNNKLYTIVKEGRHKQTWNNTNDHHDNKFKHELSILRPHFKPIIWGFYCSAIVFATFRLSGSVKFMTAVKKTFGWHNVTYNRMKKMGNSAISPPPPPLNYQNQRVNDNITTMKREFLSLPIDILLSILIGCSVSLFLTDGNKLKHDLERIPLVPGKSFISDELCSDFIEQYQRFNNHNNDDNHKHIHYLDHSERLDETLIKFIQNCQKRKDVENYLEMKEQQEENFDNELNSNSKPVIPEHGVEYLWQNIHRDTK